tara:strand:+ start:308 stop:757 length:450 start_codon:yes stop_codon:yes gene_type:complete
MIKWLMTKFQFPKLFLILLIVFLILPVVSFGQSVCQEGEVLCPKTNECVSSLELNYPVFGGFDINACQDINDLVAWAYYAIITISGLAAFFMIVTGGFQYLTSAGNPTSMGDAKDRIFNAVLGLILIFTSYLILQVINPDLLLLKLPTL